MLNMNTITNVERLAHKAELSTDITETSEGIEVLVWAYDADMLGYFTELLTKESYTYSIDASDERVTIVVNN